MRNLHGLSHKNGKRTRLHRLWLQLRNKCSNPKHQDYKYYGGRGIHVCPRWDDFTAFVADVGEPPDPFLTLDRIDNDGDYEPGNVRWATRQTQARNRNYCKLDIQKAREIITKYATGNATQKQLAAEYGVTQTLISRVTRKKTWA